MNVVPLALRTQTMERRINSEYVIALSEATSFLLYEAKVKIFDLVWPRSFVGRATDDQIQRSWVRFQSRLVIFFFPVAISHSLTRTNAQ